MSAPTALPLRPATQQPVLLSIVAASCGGVLVGDDLEVLGITHDSRSVVAGDVFVALSGERFDGSAFIESALKAGAIAVLTDEHGQSVAAAADVPHIVVSDVRAVLGKAASRVYGDPANNLSLIGITGTNGKTTTAYMVDAALRAAGKKTGLIGTITTTIDGQNIDSIRTTPEATDLYALLGVMAERGVEAVVMEVSSHALVMGRVGGLIFDVMGFTNLTQDHLDFHKSMDEYFQAKAMAFTPEHARAGVVVLTADASQPWSAKLIDQASIPLTVIAPAGLLDGDHVATLTAARGDAHGQSAVLALAGSSLEVTTPMLGSWNVRNAALAIELAVQVGVAGELASIGVGSLVAVPGRLERITSAHSDIEAFVDYAHTPDAVERVVAELRVIAGTRRLVTVIGCGGDRDSTKRSLMGAAAARLSDVVVITDDNPRSEDPAAIRAEVMAGAASVDHEVSLTEVADRRLAIQQAIDLAQPDGVVAVLGKGHESGQEVASVVTAFDDRLVVTQLLGGAQ